MLNRLHYRATTDSLARGRAFGNWGYGRGFVLACTNTEPLSRHLWSYVIAFEDRFSFLSRDFHSRSTINPGLNQAPSRTPPKIVGTNQPYFFVSASNAPSPSCNVTGSSFFIISEGSSISLKSLDTIDADECSRLLDRGGFHSFHFSLQRPHREKLIPARLTSHCGNPQHAPKNGNHPRHVLSGNSLQIQIAANPAMRVKMIAHRRSPRVKPLFARSAAPWQYARKAQ